MDRAGDAGGVEPDVLQHVRRLAVFDEFVGQAEIEYRLR